MKLKLLLEAGIAGFSSTIANGIGLISWAPRAHTETVTRTYYITDGYITQPDGTAVYFKGFSSSNISLNVPGEQLVVQEGDNVKITIVNRLSSSHSFVIDGLVDSGTIRGGKSASIEFIADKTGDFLFYDGLNAPYNRLVGLHGGFSVMPSADSDRLQDDDLTSAQQFLWLFHDIDPDWHNDISHARTPDSTYVPRYFTLNGLSAPEPETAVPSGLAAENMDSQIGRKTLVHILNAGMSDEMDSGVMHF